MESLALQNATINEVQNAQTAKDLRAKGINLYEWTPEDLAAYPCCGSGGLGGVLLQHQKQKTSLQAIFHFCKTWVL